MSKASVPSAVSFAVWHAAEQRRARHADLIRWGWSFLAVLIVTVGAAWWITRLPPPQPYAPDPPPAAIAVDLAPEPVATPTPPSDAAMGPKQTISQPVPLPDDPPPKVSAPPSPSTDPPVPVPRPEKPHPVKKRVIPTPQAIKKPDTRPPAPQTTAPPSSDARPSPSPAAPVPGSSAHSSPQTPVTWQGVLLARLEKFKRYPEQAQEDRQEGTAMLTFSMDRTGHVLSARLAGSSGHVLLDDETLALVRRAEPLPAPPDDVPGDPVTLTVPVEFYLRDLKN